MDNFQKDTFDSKSGPGSNNNERVLHTLQIWSFTIRCSLALYPQHQFWVGVGSYSSAGDTANSKPCQTHVLGDEVVLLLCKGYNLF